MIEINNTGLTLKDLQDNSGSESAATEVVAAAVSVHVCRW